ncbi:hypothetical protein LTR41_010975 [Exophiala xenobiotica]|nr:hypothetical protein LTR41_010975 [Exophiala xenobiotica]KAK5550263.1 hypothetical protein LTR46_011731 [Exophiala xenobiotica]
MDQSKQDTHLTAAGTHMEAPYEEPVRAQEKKFELSAVPSPHGDYAVDDPNEEGVTARAVAAVFALAFTYEACVFSFGLPVSVILTINRDIGPSPNFQWIATAWTLACAVTQTIAGRCSDIFGRRNFFLVGNLFGLVGCSVSSSANHINTVIAGSVLMGIGAGMQQVSFAAASEIVPKKYRGWAQGCLSFVAIPGSCFGPVIAYSLIQHNTWRYTYYLGILMNGLALILVFIFYWPPGFLGLHPEGKSRLQQFRELDFVGVFLFASGLTLFLLGITWGRNPYPWTNVHVLAPLIIGAVTVFVAFPLWEAFSTGNFAKLTPPQLVRNIRGFTVPVSTLFVSGMTLYFLQVIWPQQVQLLFTSDLSLIGWYTVAFNAGLTFGVIIIGMVFAIIKHTRVQFIVLLVTQVLFIALMATVTPHTASRAIGFVVVASLALGAFQIVAVLGIQYCAHDRDIGAATGLASSIRTAGGAIGIAIYSSIITSKVGHDLVPTLATAAVKAGLPAASVESFILALTSGSASALASVKGINDAIIGAGVAAEREVYTSAFKLVYLVSLAFGGLAIMIGVWVRGVDDQLTKQLAVKLDAPHVISHGEGEAKVLTLDG